MQRGMRRVEQDSAGVAAAPRRGSGLDGPSGDDIPRLSAALDLPWAWAVATFGGLALPMVLVWGTVVHLQSRALEVQVGQVAQLAADRLEDALALRVALAASLAERVEHQAVLGPHDFEASAAALQQQFPGYLAINRIDASGRIVQVVPEAPNRAALGKRVASHPEAGEVYLEAARTGKQQVTGPVTLFQGGKGLAAYVPIEEGRQGFVNAVFRIAPVVDATTVSLGDSYRVELRFDDRLVHASGAPQGVSAWGRTADLRLGHRPWTLTLEPTPEVAASARSGWGDLLLVLGLMSAVIVGWLAYQAAWERRRARARARQLAVAQRMQAIGTLAGGVAHDVNNLLTVILSTLDLVLEEMPSDDPSRPDLERLVSACIDAGSLSQQLVGLARGTEGPVDEGARCVPDEVVTAAVELVGRTVPRTVALVTQLEAGGVYVTGDPGRLRQVVLNLLLNATDAMPLGGTITVRSRVSSGWLVLEVEDTGDGMDEITASRAFDPFFTTKATEKGTGLGLAMVYGTVHRMGGTIDLWSRPGQGTRFTVSFPVVRGPTVPEGGEGHGSDDRVESMTSTTAGSTAAAPPR